MSEKERLARRATSALFVEVPASIAEDVHKKVSDALNEKDEKLHSLRLAVLEFFNKYLEDTDFSPHMYDLASSAGIEFAGGEWKLKEGK